MHTMVRIGGSPTIVSVANEQNPERPDMGVSLAFSRGFPHYIGGDIEYNKYVSYIRSSDFYRRQAVNLVEQ
jgi:hypothetical protein